MKYRILTLMALAALATTALARPAKPGFRTIYQPDGSAITVQLIGDEFQHIMKTSDGCAVIQDEDGWYSYARFTQSGERSSSRAHVGKAASSSVIAASRNIPTAAIKRKEIERRMFMSQACNMAKSACATKASATTGSSTTKHGIVILAQFADVSFIHTKTEFVNMLTQSGYSVNGATGCAKDYFDAQFHGIYDFQFDVTDIVTVSGKRATYGGNDSNGSDKAPQNMIIEACKLVDSSVDFSLYDDDKDGEVDNVFVFFAGGDEAEYAGDDCIWSHAWYIKDGAGVTLRLDGKLINRYACTSECTTLDGKTFRTMAPIGTFCHEYSHTFGLPDFYDTDYDSFNGQSDGLWGSTSLMDSGSYNNNSNTPPYYNAIEMLLLGLGESRTFGNGTVTLTPLYKDGIYYRLDTQTPEEYFLFECRDNSGWDKYIGGAGLLVYHIDRSSVKVSVNIQGSSYNVPALQLWDYYNMVNAKRTHQCADIIEANPSASGKYVGTTSYRSCSDIFYPYSSYKSITPSTTQKLQTWDGTVQDISITNITLSGGNITMTVLGDTDIEVPPVVRNLSVFKSHCEAIVDFTSSRDFTGEAKVQYGVSGKSAKKTVSLKPYANGRYAIRLENLSPKTSYEVTVSFSMDDIEGEQTTEKFMTSSVPQFSYPYIYLKGLDRNSDGSFPSSARLPLMIGGVTDVEGVDWFFKGYAISAGTKVWYTPSESGELKAEIVYKDGTRDSVVKYIEIK